MGMTASNYDQALKYTLGWEGGYSNDPGDPGGPTMWGITIWDARRYWKHDATANDVRHMPIEVAKAIYKSKYWDRVNGDALPPGVDFSVFDYEVNSGVRGAMVLQRLVGVPDDGIVGPRTIAAANDFVAQHGAAALVHAIWQERLHFLRSLRTWSLFGRGWYARCIGGEKQALGLIPKVAGFGGMGSDFGDGDVGADDPGELPPS